MSERRKHRRFWRPSPAFEWVLFPLFALVIALLSTCTWAAETETRSAPLVRITQTDGVLLQTGWFRYPKSDDALVLYCVEQTDTKVTCIVYTTIEGKNVVVLVPDISVGTSGA